MIYKNYIENKRLSNTLILIHNIDSMSIDYRSCETRRSSKWSIDYRSSKWSIDYRSSKWSIDYRSSKWSIDYRSSKWSIDYRSSKWSIDYRSSKWSIDYRSSKWSIDYRSSKCPYFYFYFLRTIVEHKITVKRKLCHTMPHNARIV